MTRPEQQAMDAFWQDCQEHAQRRAAKDEAINKLLSLCREIIKADDDDQLQEKIPAMAYYIRSAVDELEDVF